MEYYTTNGKIKRGGIYSFQDGTNKMLLWHGSRLSNWAGILSQGLRIAPPEAPCTGYMFGKGVYFADMVTKSANYCFATKTKNTGLLMLCEVVLGNQHELLQADCNLHDTIPKVRERGWRLYFPMGGASTLERAGKKMHICI